MVMLLSVSSLLSLLLASPWAVNAGVAKSKKSCTVKSHGDIAISDTPYILDAFKKCGNGGVIKFPKGKTWAMNELTIIDNCKSCEVQLDGTLRLGDNVTWWSTPNLDGTNRTLYIPFQASQGAFVLKGWKDALFHSPKGTGLIDGAGQRWWDAFAGQEALDPNSLRRPILMVLMNSKSVMIKGLQMINPPNWFNLVQDSSYITYTGLTLHVESTNSNPPKNSDGIDTYRSDHITFKDSYLTTGDDCVSFKPNSTNIVVKNLVCNGSHGISVGSLAQYVGVYDIVENVSVTNITFNGDDQAFRIKTWAGDNHGSGLVKNVLYKDITVNNVGTGLVIDACYFSAAECAAGQAARLNIEDVLVKNLHGTTQNQVVADITCPPGAICDVKFEDIDLHPADGSDPIYQCENLSSDSGIPCTSP